MNDPGKFAEYRQTTLALTSRSARLWRGLPSWWSTLADTLGIAAVFATIFITNAERNVLFVIILLAATAATALGAALWLHRRSQKTVAYAHAMAGIHTAIHILRDQLATVDNWTEARIKTCLAEVLGAFSVAFTLIVNAPCRACIKVIDLTLPEGTTEQQITAEDHIHYCYARTFCRDFLTAEQIGQGDLLSTEAPIHSNTAFRFLFQNVRQRYFVG